MKLNVLVLVLLPVLVYAQSLGNGFVALDDELLILDNPKVHGLTFEHVRDAFTTYDPELYVPLTLLTYQMEYALFGPNPVAFHATSLLLHIMNTLLVFAVLRRLLGGAWGAFVLSLLFAVHPLHTEAIAWASGQKDLLAATFFLGSLSTYLTFKATGKQYALSVVLFALGLLAKVSVAPLPFVLVLVDWLRGERIDRANLRQKLPYFTLAAIFLVVAFFGKQVQVRDLWAPLLLSFIAIPFYLGKLLVPLNLSIFYPFTGDVTFLHPRIFGGLLLVLAVTIAAVLVLRRSRVPAFAWFSFLLLLAPSFLNVLKGSEVGINDLYFASDRYAYLPSIVLLVAVGSPLSLRAGRWLLLLVLPLVFLTARQSLVWRESETLFRHAVAAQGNSHVAMSNLAGLLARSRRLDEAAELYDQSLAIRRTPMTLFNLAQVRAAQGMKAEAVELYEELLALRPDHAHGHAKLGSLELQRGNIDQAFILLERARELDPGIPSVHYNLGLMYEHLGRTDDARRSFERVLELDPRDSQALRKLGRGSS